MGLLCAAGTVVKFSEYRTCTVQYRFQVPVLYILYEVLVGNIQYDLYVLVATIYCILIY